MKILLAAIVSLIAIGTAAPASAAGLAALVQDPGKVLSPVSAAKIAKAATAFEALTGRQMVVIVLPGGPVPDLDGLSSLTGVPPNLPGKGGIVYAASLDKPTGRLFIVDPAWQKQLPTQWGFMFPRRLVQKYGEEPFERRVVLSAQYLAEVFPAKLAFVLKPRGGTLNEGSLKFARGSYIGLEILGLFIIAFTVFRTFWPSRLKDEDQDEFSNELRRLKKERQIW